jgi:glycosyltransferase involved in cell wall biosynthesis
VAEARRAVSRAVHSETPLVSIVIPCYNHAHFLVEAIESALAQTYRNVEVIVVDDGSPDNTAEVTARYASVRYVRQVNQGLSAARNRGLRESHGEYVIFVDADDRLLPEAAAVGVAELQARRESAFVSGMYRNIAEDGSPLPTPPFPRVGSDHYEELLLRNHIGAPSTVMYRRSVLDVVGGFDVAESPAADYDLYLRIARRFPIHRHPAVVSEYRRYPKSMSRNAGVMLRSVLHVLRAQRRYASANPRYKVVYRQSVRGYREKYGERLVEQVRAAARAHQWRLALHGALVLLIHYPRGFATHACRKAYCIISRRRSGSELSGR